MKTNIILQGDALTKLKELPEKSINMCMTSPPYWALRDYGTANWDGGDKNCNHKIPEGEQDPKNKNNTSHNVRFIRDVCYKCGAKRVDKQLGLEPTSDQYISSICDIFDKVKRVLRDDGTCWVNIGDTYMNNSSYSEKGRQGYGNDKIGMINKSDSNIKTKSLTMIPMRFAIEMVNRGWILRNTIIWHKPNAMPCSVKDRFTVDFEYIFFFSKKKKYYFETQYDKLQTNENRPHGAVRQREYNYNSKYEGIHFEKKVRQGMHKDRGNNYIEKRDLQPQKDFVNKLRENFNVEDLVSKGLKRTTVEHWFRYDENGFSYPTKEEWENVGTDMFPELLNVRYELDEIKSSSNGKNKRTTWSLNPKPYSEAPFAVYPEELSETPIKAGCPVGGIVLDPFFGAGTTGLVALKQNKKFLGIELNKEYNEIDEKRM